MFLASKATATTDEVYKTGTTFDEVYALYNFDRALRNIYLKYHFYKNMKPADKTTVAKQFNLHTIGYLLIYPVSSNHRIDIYGCLLLNACLLCKCPKVIH